MIRGIFLSGITGLAMSGCSIDDEQSSIALAQNFFFPVEFMPSARFAELFSEPRPVLDVEFVDLAVAGKLILEQQDGPYARYLSADLGSIVLHRGLLHSLYGFGEPLVGADVSDPLRLILNGRSGRAHRFHTYLDGEDRAIKRTYRCEVSVRGSSEVTFESNTVKTTLISETCQNRDQYFENLYWVDRDRGEVIQSRQWAGKNVGFLMARITTP